MAGSITYNDLSKYTVAGNLRFAAGIMDCADGAGATITTGFDKIANLQVSIKSAATGNYIQGFTFDAVSSITCPTVESGDTVYVAIWGK